MAAIKNILSEGLSDQELIVQYKQSGDLKVLGALFERYMDLLYGVCLKYLREPETAKDSVMAIFEELVQKLKMHEVYNFKGWLHTLAKNHCLMQLRTTKQFRTQEIDIDRMQFGEEMHLNDMPDKEEELVQLSKCMETLPSEQKITVELFYLQSKCYREITIITGLDWNQVRSHIQNGRRNLKICLEKKTFHQL